MLPMEAMKLITGSEIRTVVKISRQIGMNEEDISITGKQLILTLENKTEGFTCWEIFDSEATIIYLYELVVEEYLNVFTTGYNVNILLFGSNHSEKGKLIEGGR